MNTNYPSESIHSLVRCTEDAVDVALTANHSNQRHMEYLPYPDENWHTAPESTTDGQNPLEAIYSQCNETFARGQPVQVIQLRAERIYHPVIEFLHPYLYIITIRYGSVCEWTIRRRYKHFADLHYALRAYVRTQFRKLNKIKTMTNADQHGQEAQPCFPTQNDRLAFITGLNIEKRCKLLQEYLNKVLDHPTFREHFAMRSFLEVSPLSFVRGLGKSAREGSLSKRANDDYRGRSIFLRIPILCDLFKLFYEPKWFVLKDSYLVYMQFDSGAIGFPMLVDRAFSLDRTFRKTGTNKGIRVTNLQRRMLIKCAREEERDRWFDSLLEMKDRSVFAQPNLFDSFAPKRERQYAQWFINGQSYMEALAKAILGAREEIFISGWWLSPEIMLVRPAQDETMRLDNLLGKRAEEGIRVYVLIYKDMVKVVGLNSLHTKNTLMSKSPTKNNIKVIRHPEHRVLSGAESSFLYSHHEKTVIIDQRLAFIGGIDLCWGRWDTDDYRLVDLSDENITELKLPGQLASQPEEESRKEEAAVDTTEGMAENKTNTNPISALLDHPADSEREETKRNGNKIRSKGFFQGNDSDDSSDEQAIIGAPPVLDGKCRFFLGKDYSNYYHKDFEAVEKFDEDYIDRKLAPRMPWHDEVLAVSGEAARDCARHFIQRWNIHKAEKHRFDDTYPYLLPKAYDDPELSDTSMLQTVLSEDRSPIAVDAQCVRSASLWSCGIERVERSIHSAYVDMIDHAQHYIYIENQFFVTITKDETIKNDVGDALYRRIIRAHTNGDKFRIFILLPLLPGFANSNAVQAELYYIMGSINKGEHSLYQRLRRAGVTDPEEYVTFYGMRNWDILMGSLITEIIYVHSKLMIVDDRMCICGSANINDRSFQGTRDSEVCLVVNDIDLVDSHLNGQPTQVGKFCSTWRKRLFRQILGVEGDEKINIDDPCSDELYDYFRRTARKNTQIYEGVFNAVPTNKIRRFSDIKGYNQQSKLKETDPHAAHDQCKQIQGFIVQFPIEFLADDDIKPKWNTSEGIAPISLWT